VERPDAAIRINSERLGFFMGRKGVTLVDIPTANLWKGNRLHQELLQEKDSGRLTLKGVAGKFPAKSSVDLCDQLARLTLMDYVRIGERP
jgi:hypothetical protein